MQSPLTNPSLANGSYNEMLFMIDTCQANTLYSRFYSPNIIATGSSAIDQSSYSHHADNDVGVAVIDRYTYYNLDFLESQVTSPGSKLTLGNLFDSYDERKIHSQPGIRWDLFPGGEQAGRQRLVMDFFGNVQGVEIEAEGGGGRVSNESEWSEDLRRLGEIWKRGMESDEERKGGSSTRSRTINQTTTTNPTPRPVQEHEQGQQKEKEKEQKQKRPHLHLHLHPGAATKVQATSGWAQQQFLGVSALAGCAIFWVGARWLEGGGGGGGGGGSGSRKKQQK